MKNTKYMRLCAGAVCIALCAASLSSWGKSNRDTKLFKALNTFNSAVKQLQENYVDTIDGDKVMKIALEAMLLETDPYTEYYTADEVKAFKTETTGEYAGVGSYIMQRDGGVYFSGPYEGSPSALAGIRSGDRILRIDTTDVREATSERVSKLLRGQAGTPVRIVVQRPYATPDSILTFDIDRAKLQLPSVPYYGKVGSDIGYIKLTSFMQTSPQEVQTALKEFAADPQLKGVVLDLRGNGGGLVTAAVEIAGYFLPKGTEILTTKGRDKSEVKTYRTTHTPIMPSTPLAILIDGGSASASEIVAGAMQDYDRAVLLGSRSFGKGLVQSTLPLPYDQMLKVTTAKYYMPSGRLIQALDYSRRNDDGSVAPTPDSLCNTYHTKHGRVVKDGGGLKPDIEIDWGKPSRLVYNLVRDNWVFDYATRYAATHPSVVAPSEFEITDSIYADFKNSIDPSRLKYDKVCEDMLTQLEKAAETEGYMNDSTRTQFDAMRALLTHNLGHDLDTHRRQISEYLGSEIMSRYYHNRGEVIYSLRDDEALNRAANTLRSPSALDSLGIMLPVNKHK